MTFVFYTLYDNLNHSHVMVFACLEANDHAAKRPRCKLMERGRCVYFTLERTILNLNNFRRAI